MPHGISPPPGVACTTSKEGSNDTNRFQALYRPEHAGPNQVLQLGSGQLRALIHRSAWKGNSPKVACKVFSEAATVFSRLPCGERDIPDTRRRTVPPSIRTPSGVLPCYPLVAFSKDGQDYCPYGSPSISMLCSSTATFTFHCRSSR